jgi:hypothetical protein
MELHIANYVRMKDCNMQNRLAAFTLTDLAVSLLISSIAIALTITCFTLIERQHINFQERSDAVATWEQFHMLIMRDAINAKSIQVDEQGKLTFFGVQDSIRCTYLVNKDRVECQRQSAAINFELPGVVDSLSFLEGSQEMVISMKFQNKARSFLIEKEYAAADVINTKSHAH